MTSFSPLLPVCFVSTHLDDVALSCSNYLIKHPGTIVVTVMAGAPKIQCNNEWNSNTTGKDYAPDAIDARKNEDASAMRALKAKSSYLDLWDAPYLDGKNQDEQQIADKLESFMTKNNIKSAVAPLGFHHSDHIAVSNASAKMAKRLNLELYFYLDMPYAMTYPEEYKDRLAELADKGLLLQLLEPINSMGDTKEVIFRLYKSQFEAVKNDHLMHFKKSLIEPEHYFRVL